MSEPEIAFYFDFLSPYAYVAWKEIHALAARTNATVSPRPTLLAALLADGKTRGPAEIPKKRVYVFKDAFRSAKLLGHPFALPRTHPWNPLLSLRIAGLAVGATQQNAVIDALFAASWGGGQVALDDPEELTAWLEAAGLPGEALVHDAQSSVAKERLRTSTEGAIERGVFGVPSMCVGGEVFWGFDAFGHLERYLRGEDPLSEHDVASWATLASSAARRLEG